MNIKTHLLILLVTVFFALSSRSQDRLFAAYRVKEFSFQGHHARIVFPTTPHEKRLWVWRARFWGHEPQVDQALLERGFHVVYVDVADLFGNEEAVAIWNAFYAFCRAEYQLNPRVVLEGMSRGGLILYNWAAQNTDKVFSIYADAPVCDIKSWPGGLYEGTGSPQAWQLCLAAYGLDTLSVKAFRGIPIYTCISVAKAGIPVLHVYGEADTVVPYSENTALLAEQFRQACGVIELIGKAGVGHHPHSLADPKPIVDFILKSIERRE